MYLSILKARDLAKARSRLFDTIGTMSEPTVSKLRDLLGLIDDLDATACEGIHQRQAEGSVTGLPELDEAIGGALPAGLTVLQGAPGAGKSALGLQIAVELSIPGADRLGRNGAGRAIPAPDLPALGRVSRPTEDRRAGLGSAV
jgi:replicative DNA helicase